MRTTVRAGDVRRDGAREWIVFERKKRESGNAYLIGVQQADGTLSAERIVPCTTVETWFLVRRGPRPVRMHAWTWPTGNWKGHRFTPETAREAGRKGAQAGREAGTAYRFTHEDSRMGGKEAARISREAGTAYRFTIADSRAGGQAPRKTGVSL